MYAIPCHENSYVIAPSIVDSFEAPRLDLSIAVACASFVPLLLLTISADGRSS